MDGTQQESETHFVSPGVLGPALVGLVLVVLLTATWGRSAELLVDFGRELYVAWRIAEGDVLYRDLAYFSGPLSPHVNALWFRLWGPGIQGLLILNVIILALFTAVSYHILNRLTGPIPAVISSSAFLGLCVFAQYTTYGSFNFVAPYSHELTHGLLVTSLGLLFVRRTGDGSVVSALGVGTCIGLSLLTKPEVALAATVALTVGIGLAVAGAGWTGRQRITSGILLLAGVLIPAAVFAAFRTEQGFSWMEEALLGPWSAVAQAEVRALPFYQAAPGLDAPGVHSLRLMTWSAIWAGAIGVPLLILRRVPVRFRERPTIGLWVFAGSLPLALATVVLANGSQAFAPLPVAVLILIGLLLLGLPRKMKHANRGDWALSIAGCLFSLLLLAKLGFRPQLGWYGFALAAPALLAVIASIFGPLPRRLAQRPGSSGAIIGSAAAWLIAVATLHGAASWAQYQRRTFVVGEGQDRIRVDPARGQALQPALRALRQTLQPGQNLLVLPEGAAINFLLRVPNPTPFINFMPPELILFGEDQILAAFQESPPDFVLLVPKPGGDFGGTFGFDFGVDLHRWIQATYAESEAFPGGEVFGEPFIVRLLTPREPLDDFPSTTPRGGISESVILCPNLGGDCDAPAVGPEKSLTGGRGNRSPGEARRGAARR